MPTEASRSSSIVWSAGGRPSPKQRWGQIAQSASFPVTLPGEWRSVGVIRPYSPSDSVIARRPFSERSNAFCKRSCILLEPDGRPGRLMRSFGRAEAQRVRRLRMGVNDDDSRTTKSPFRLRHSCPTRIESGHSIRFGVSGDGHPARSSSVIAGMGSTPCARARCTADQVVR